MNRFIPRNMVASAVLAGLAIAIAPPHAIAQRGPSFMNSPGYQRALTESRKQLKPRPPVVQTHHETIPRRAHKRQTGHHTR